MKTVGLLGGMSWESSVEYERIMNEAVRERLGGTHSADLLLRSYDFAQIEYYQEVGDWDAVAQILASDARHLQDVGADAIVICTNTMHRVAAQIEVAIDIPLLHIADATAAAIDAVGLDTVALLGTRYTMEQEFYRGRLEQHGLTVLIPDEPDRAVVHDVIYDELVQGVISDDSRAAYIEIIERLQEEGARGVIAGCTEIEQLVSPEDVEIPLFPTARIHAMAAVEFALAEE